ncbi:hypothetical protein Ahy_A02g005123 isoform A [Arachis hypogaea]|uniref:U3 small nucleolar RNA-associated protein 15 C-terminal domain-containing protein n=1 Tax=Arachis hypogaea TaxID=3818 RepID=A0A445E5T9_ARAHY|nr:hypothetical protein Ahy_A02g005123 isoform A [Arachis hypogaea]
MAEPLHSSQPKIFPVKPKQKPKPRTQNQTPESKYWSSFKNTQIQNLISVPSLTFSPSSPHPFAAAHSATVSIYKPQNDPLDSPTTTITSFKDVVSSLSFRSDGRLLAAGDLSGLVQLRVISAGDDALVKVWDVAAGDSPVMELRGHRDYVRCGDSSPVDADTFITGSYDHTVKLWDVRVGDSKPAIEVNHGNPVEDVVFLPAGGMVATAGGNSVKFWDLISGGKLVCSMEGHNKTVTSLCIGRIGSGSDEELNQFRVLSVGLDGYMKVFDYSSMKVTHSMRFPAPLLSVAYSPDCKTRVIGTSNGIIYVGKRKIKEEEIEGRVSEKSLFWRIRPLEHTQKKVFRPSHFRYFQRGQGEKPSEGDYLIMRPKKEKLGEHDKLLKNFRHGEALVSVLEGKNPGNVLAVMEELVSRKKLMVCVSNLDAEKLELLLVFLRKYCTVPRYSGLLMGLARKVLKMRVDEIRGSEALKAHIQNLKRSIEEEIKIQQSLQEIQGIISPLLKIAGRR